VTAQAVRFLIRRATPVNIEVVMALLDQRIAWLREHGSDQWSTREFRPRMITSIREGHTWLMYERTTGPAAAASTPVATITASPVGDRDFWTPQELRHPTLYLSKLATALNRRGHGLGALLIDWARDHGARTGHLVARWDVWRTNHQLQAYYRRMPHVRYLRTVNVPGRYSGALFETDCVRVPELADQLVEHDDLEVARVARPSE
jgi:GNAT superfamily N-acetyltransferase